MLALARFLYVLQNTPHKVPDAYFISVEREVRILLWDGKSSRIATHKLTRGWYDGGIALPDLKQYYWTSQLAVVNQWVFAPPSETAYLTDRWVMAKGGYLRALYSSPKTQHLTSSTAQTVALWHCATKKLGWHKKLTFLTPL